MTKKVVLSRNGAPCEAVMLLIKRMESHPEEFRLDRGKWAGLMAHVKKRVADKDADALIILDDFEVQMLWGKFRAAGKEQLLKFTLEKILIEEEK